MKNSQQECKVDSKNLPVFLTGRFFESRANATARSPLVKIFIFNVEANNKKLLAKIGEEFYFQRKLLIG